MNEANRSWSGPFAGQRVPININAIFIGFFAILMLIAGVYVIELFSDENHLIAKSSYFFFSCLGDSGLSIFKGLLTIVPGNKNFGNITATPSYQSMFSLFTWFLFVWAFFGGAINRIVANNIAKQDSVSIAKAFRFAWKHKFSLFFTPIALATVIAFFCGCNYMAGWLTLQFPVVGAILFVALFFLVILSSFFIVILGIGLIFGFNLISSSIATEGCEGIEGVITSLQYIYSRPWSYMMYHGFVIISCVFLLWVGGIFVSVTFNTSLIDDKDQISLYNFHENWKQVEVTKLKITENGNKEYSELYYLDEKRYTQLQNDAKKEIAAKETTPEEKENAQQRLNNLRLYKASVSDIWAYLNGVSTYSYLWEKESNEVEPNERAMKLINFWHLDKFWTCIGVFLMIFYYGTQYFVYGYIFAYIFASSTLIYFLLRKEIDATDFDEIWEEKIEESLESKDIETESVEEIEDVEDIEDVKDVKDNQKEKNKPLATSIKFTKTDIKNIDKKKTDINKSDNKKPESKKTDDKKPDSKKTDDKKSNDNKTDNKKSDDKKADDKKSDDKKADDKKSDDKKSDDKKSNDKKSDDKKSDDKKSDDKKSDDNKTDDKKSSSNKTDDKKSDGNKTDDKKSDDNKTDDKKTDDKKLDTKSKEKDIKSSDSEKESGIKTVAGKNETNDKIKKLDTSTMAIPLIKRKPKKTKDADKNKFMD